VWLKIFLNIPISVQFFGGRNSRKVFSIFLILSIFGKQKRIAMLKIKDLRSGNIITVNDEGVVREGMVASISHEENEALVDNGVQEFWYTPEEMQAISLDEGQLDKFGFEKEEMNGAIKYKKGVFRLVTPKKGDFSNIEMWYREDRRHFSFPLAVHELQNLHMDMSKIPLERPTGQPH
jgi:hypothetical protein